MAGWLAVGPSLAGAQGGPPVGVQRDADGSAAASAKMTALPTTSSFINPALAPVASAIVPGSGQAMLGQDRSLVYVAVEALMWLKRAKDAREERDETASYELLAQNVARGHFSTSLPVGTWDYYESMEHWLDSGPYSVAESGPIVPDTVSTEYNGSRWILAERNNGIDPANPPPPSSTQYQAALAEYAATAVTPNFRWSWDNAQLQLDLYQQTVQKRNEAASAATFDVTVLIANHVLSMVDAFTGFRLHVRSSTSGQMDVYDSIPVWW
jgi:hypothetical protein